ISSRVRGSSGPGAPITAFSVFQVRSRISGWLARPRQKLLTKSDFRVARISSNTALTFGCASASASVQSLTVAILASLVNAPPATRPPDHGEACSIAAMIPKRRLGIPAGLFLVGLVTQDA